MSNSDQPSAVLNAENLSRSFTQGGSTLTVLQQIELSVAEGERVAIIGHSGSGKSTLLHLLAGLDKPSSGQVCIDGTDLSRLGATALGRLRNRSMGFIYQFHHLIMELTALENVELPGLIGKRPQAQTAQRAKDLLERLGLGARMSHKPGQLSGGERQRVAIARALINQPRCILADEPTGNLDEDTANQVFDLMMELNRESRSALVMVTHDQRLAARADRILLLRRGHLQPFDPSA